jgi:PAS domain S-box-containing protein
LRANPIFDAQGQIVALMGVFTDVSERLKAQQKITEQAALLDRAQDAIIIRDLRGQVTYWNQGATAIYGWTSAEAVGRPVVGLLYRDDAPYLNAVEKILQDGEWTCEMHHSTKSGREVTVQSRWTLLRDDRGAPRSILTINTDITEKKRLEGQFLRAQRMESIGTLAGGIAHDLNNVLAPIIMSIDLLRLSHQSPENHEILNQVEVSARRGADLVRQVLSFARGVGGSRISVNVGSLINDVVKIAKETFPRSIEIRSEQAFDLHAVIGDPTQLHQVLINLCVNARDALPTGGLLVLSARNATITDEMALRMQSSAGHFVQITVTDNGTGIPAEIHDKIFEPFFTTKELGKGTGLGLSTVLAIVRSHGGFLEVESQLGRGSRFHIYLPYTDHPVEPLSGPARKTVPLAGGELILVVEDEPPVRNLLRNILENHGYKVITADNGDNGLSAYAEHSAEVRAVITDMMMPVMDGPALIQSLRKINAQVPVIAVSGLYQTLNIEKATAAGANTFLAKPFTAESILQCLHNVLENGE